MKLSSATKRGSSRERKVRDFEDYENGAKSWLTKKMSKKVISKSNAKK